MVCKCSSAVTSFYKLSGLKQHIYYFTVKEVRSLTGLKSAVFLSESSSGDSFILLCPASGDCVPQLMVPFLQLQSQQCCISLTMLPASCIPTLMSHLLRKYKLCHDRPLACHSAHRLSTKRPNSTHLQVPAAHTLETLRQLSLILGDERKGPHEAGH